MRSRTLILVFAIAVSACQQSTDSSSKESAEPDRAAASNAASDLPSPSDRAAAASDLPQADASATAAAGCADRLTFVVDSAPEQMAVQDGMPQAQLERVRSGTERRFKRVAAAMCSAGELRASLFQRFDRVLVTDAEGASEPAIYPGQGRTLHYELAFAGDPTVPPAPAFRAALLCLADPGHSGCLED